jgi:hypothetical protein
MYILNPVIVSTRQKWIQEYGSARGSVRPCAAVVRQCAAVFDSMRVRQCGSVSGSVW